MSRTHEALRRAEANFQKRNFQEKNSLPIGRIELIEKLETLLLDLGLSQKQILTQDLKKIGHSLKLLDRCIINPKASLNFQAKDLETDDYRAILPVLIDRKKLLLNQFYDLVSKIKYYNIKRLLNKITDNNIKTSLQKIINDLYIRDKILKKEFKKLEQMLSTIDNEQHKKKDGIYQKINENAQAEPENKAPGESIRMRNSLGILILGVLLICITLFIAIAPFVNIFVPNSLNITFFILLGFFFGLTIAKLVKI